MSSVILVTGGCRSGKSSYAQQLAENLPGPYLFLATCQNVDEEMAARIRRHQADRQDRGWQTIEEPIDPASIISQTKPDTVLLLDCLTLWVSNLLLAAEDEGRQFTEKDMIHHAKILALACHQHKSTAILVTNEVGLGIVPDNPLARKYRDLVGRCNQQIATAADQVILVSCGLPLHLKTTNRAK